MVPMRFNGDGQLQPRRGWRYRGKLRKTEKKEKRDPLAIERSQPSAASRNFVVDSNGYCPYFVRAAHHSTFLPKLMTDRPFPLLILRLVGRSPCVKGTPVLTEYCGMGFSSRTKWVRFLTPPLRWTTTTTTTPITMSMMRNRRRRENREASFSPTHQG